MFTGIVEEVGKVLNIERKGASAVIKIGCSYILNDVKIGDSIAVNGVCLTVVDFTSDYFKADISYETLNRSSLDHLARGDRVNLERALKLTSRLGGHLVLGHVDGIGRIVGVKKVNDSYEVSIGYPENLDRYIAEKGSVAVDGISLTVAECVNRIFKVAIIPHTFSNTNLIDKRVGDVVNLEVDVVARYLEKLLKNTEKDSKLIESLKNLSALEDF